MKAFFEKYGGGQEEPYHAVKLMCEQLYRVKDKVKRGDSNVKEDLGILSDMIDDFLKHSQGVHFRPHHKMYPAPEQGGGYEQEEYGYEEQQMPYQRGGGVGYHYFPPIYPLWPRMQGQGGQQGGQQGGGGSRPGGGGGGSSRPNQGGGR